MKYLHPTIFWNYLTYKRFFDLIIAILLLFALSPLFLLISLLIFLCLGKPIFYCQTRIGIHGHPFTIFKFRTMANLNLCDQSLLSDFDRLSPLGLLLRSSSLDEIPGLINVIKGEMSLVGPRPLLPDYLPLYTPEQARRHSVYPGITGLAQVKGRNSISWEEKFRFDVWYVDNVSFLLDLKILLYTFKSVFLKTGVNADSAVTMPRFTGNISNSSER